jgi:hypothetical protein
MFVVSAPFVDQLHATPKFLSTGAAGLKTSVRTFWLLSTDLATQNILPILLQVHGYIPPVAQPHPVLPLIFPACHRAGVVITPAQKPSK